MCLTLLMVGELLCQGTVASPEPGPSVSSLGIAESPCPSLNEDTYNLTYVYVHSYTSARAAESSCHGWHPALFRRVGNACSDRGTRGRIFKGQICHHPEPVPAARAAKSPSPLPRRGLPVCAACRHGPGVREKETDDRVFLV